MKTNDSLITNSMTYSVIVLGVIAVGMYYLVKILDALEKNLDMHFRNRFNNSLLDRQTFSKDWFTQLVIYFK